MLLWVATYLHLMLTRFKKKRQKPQTHKHSYFSELQKGFLGRLQTFYIYWIFFKLSKATDTQAQAFRWITQRAPWVATYLHFIYNGFSKSTKIRGHTSTGILVNYPEAFLGGYLPTFYIN